MGRVKWSGHQWYPDFFDLWAPHWMRFQASYLGGGLLLQCLTAFDGKLLHQMFCPGWRSPGDRWEEQEVLRMKFVKAALAKSAVKVPGRVVPPDPQMVKHYPALWEFMSLEEIEGVARETATINLSWGSEQGFMAFLNDRASKQYICVTGDSLTFILAALNSKLMDEDPGWRESKGAPPRKKKGT